MPLLVTTLCAFFILGAVTQAQTSWKGTSSTNWNDAANWTSGVPGTNTDVIIGDANFTGLFQPTITTATPTAGCGSLSLGPGAAPATLTVIGTLSVSRDLTIAAKGTVVHNSTSTSRAITVKGNWTNQGTYAVSNSNSQITFGGKLQQLSGTTTFHRLTINSGATLTLLSDIVVLTQSTITGTLDPSESPTHTLSGPGKLTVSTSGILMVKAPFFGLNYPITNTLTLSGGSTVNYASASDQSVSSQLTYSTLMVSGGGVKRLTNNLPTLLSTSTSYGRITVSSGTLDLGPYLANRATTNVGGTLTLAAGTRLRVSGTNNFPNFNTVALNAASFVDYVGANQVVAGKNYGHLLLSGNGGNAVKTMPTNAITVYGDLTASVGSGTSLVFAANAAITVRGNLNLGPGCTFNAGSFASAVYKNWTNDGVFLGSSGTMSLAGANTIITGSGSNFFNNLTLSASGIVADSNTTLVVSGKISKGNSYTFTQLLGGTGSVTFSGAAGVISGNSYTFGRVRVTGSVSTVATFAIKGDLEVTGTFNATSGTITLNGSGVAMTGNGSITFYVLTIPGSVVADASFGVRSTFTVAGSLTATAGTASFLGSTTLSGSPQLNHVLFSGTLLRLSAGSSLGIAGTYTQVGGSFNCTTYRPNTVTFNGTDGQNIPALTYHHLRIAGSGTKVAAGNITVNGDLTIASTAGFAGGSGSFTNTVAGNWFNQGNYAPGNGIVVFSGAYDSMVDGTTVFNVLRANKTSSSVRVNLATNITTSLLDMLSGTLNTGTNALTVTGHRTGTGVAIGTLIRQHDFLPNTAYAFESPFTTLLFPSLTTITSVTMTVTLQPAPEFPAGACVARHYDLSLASAGPYSATLRLHYLDTETGGDSEADLQIWHPTPTWTALGRSAGDVSNNWVEQTNITELAGLWTLSDQQNVAAWIGAQNSDWENPANWTAVQGGPEIPPSTNDVAQLGILPFTHQPHLTTTWTLRGLSFASTQPVTLTLAPGGALSVLGNVSGTWTNDAAHTLDVGDQVLSVGGELNLSDEVSNHLINLNLGSGTLNVGNALVIAGGSSLTVTGPGILNLAGDFLLLQGNLNAPDAAVNYVGSGSQIVAGNVAYHSLTISKSAGTANLLTPATVANNLLVSSNSIFSLGADLSIGGNVQVDSSAFLRAQASRVTVGGHWLCYGGFDAGSSTLLFNGAGTQIFNGTQVYSLDIMKPPGASMVLSNNVTIGYNLRVQGGTLDLGGFGADRATPGSDLVLGADTLLRTASHFPTNFAAYSFASSSTVEYYSTNAQVVVDAPYANLLLQNGGANSKTLLDNLTVLGDLTVGQNATLDAAGNQVTLEGNWTNAGAFVSSSNLVVLEGLNKTVAGAVVFNDLNVPGRYTVAGDTLSILGNLAVTGFLDAGTTAVRIDGDLLNAGTLISSGATTFTGTRVQNISLLNAIQSTSHGTVNFNGTFAPVLDSTSPPQFANLNINNTGGITPSQNWAVYGNFSIGPGASFLGGDLTHTFYGSVTNTGSFASSGLLVFHPLAASSLKLGSSFNSSGEVRFEGGAPLALVGGPLSFTSVTVANTHASGVTANASWSIAGDFAIASGSIFHAGLGLQHSLQGTLLNQGTLEGGTSSFQLGDSIISGTGSTTFGSLIIGSAANPVFQAPVNLTGSLTNNGVLSAASTRISFLGNASAVLAGSATDCYFGILEVNKPGVLLNIPAGVSIASGLSVVAGTVELSAGAWMADPSASLGVADGAVLKLSGAVQFPAFGTVSFSRDSLVEYAGTGAQTISARSYGNLTSSSTGARTLPPGATIHVAGTFSPGTNAYTVTGSTVDYNGASSQTIAAFAYCNLSSSGSGARRFSTTGAISIGASFSPGSNDYVTDNSTVQFIGAAQTIPALSYCNLTTSGSGTKTLAGDVTVNGTLNLGAGTLADAGFTLQVKGNANNQVTHSGTGRILLTQGVVPHLLSGSGTYARLELNDLQGALLDSADLTVSSTLTLTQGILSTSTNKVVLLPSAGVARGGGYVNGPLQKRVPAGNPIRQFEIGDTNGYAPVLLSFDLVNTPGDIVVGAHPGAHPDLVNSGLDVTHAILRYWSLTNVGTAFTSCSASFQFPAQDLGSNPDSGYLIAQLRQGTWTRLTPAQITGTNIVASGLADFGDFVLGEPAPRNGIWTNASGGNWISTTNWLNGGIATGPGMLADFSQVSLAADAVVTLDVARTLGALIFGDQSGSHGWVLSSLTGEPLTLDGAGQTPTLTVTSGHATIAVSLRGSHELDIAGPGDLTLSGDNNYDGLTRVTAGGKLWLAHNHGLGSSLGSTRVETGGSLAISSDNLSIPENLFLSGNGSMAEGAFHSGSAMSTHLTGAITIQAEDTRLAVDHPNALLALEGPLSLEHSVVFGGLSKGSGDVQISGPITGPGGLRIGNGLDEGVQVDLLGPNFFLGITAVRKGSLILHHSNALQFSTVNWSRNPEGSPAGFLSFADLSDAVLGGLNGDRELSLPNGFTLRVGNNNTSTLYSGSLGGVGSRLAKVGTGSLTLSGANTFSGGLLIENGPTNVAARVPGSASVVVSNPDALGSGLVSISGNMEGLRALEFDLSGGAFVPNPIELPAAGANVIGIHGLDSLTDFNLLGQITGGHAGLTLRLDFANFPGGVMHLSNPSNSFTANLEMASGTLEISDSGALGNPNNVLHLNQQTLASDSLRFDTTGLVLPQSIILGGDSVLEVQGHEATLAGSLSGGLTSHSVVVSGGQLIAGDSVGSLRLAGDNDFGAALVVGSPNTKLIIASPRALGDPSAGTSIGSLVNNSTIAFENLGVYAELEPFSIQGRGTLVGGHGVGALENLAGSNTLNGPVHLNGDANIGVTDGALTLAGRVDGTSVLSKVGPGRLILTGTNQTSAIFVESGTLQIGDGLSTGEVDCDIDNAGQLIFHPGQDLTFSHTISGTGAFVQNGPGALILSRQNPLSGSVRVAAGSLVLADSIGSNLVACSELTLDEGASLLWAEDWQVNSSARVVLNGGSLRPAGHKNILGELVLTTNSFIQLSPGSPSRLEFAPSDPNAWTSIQDPPSEGSYEQTHYFLSISNWSSADIVRFGTNAAGLGSDGPEFRQVRFVNFENSGLITNGYLRPDGVVVPTTRVNHSTSFAILVQPSASAIAGAPFAQPVTVAVLDEFGVVDTTDNTTIVAVSGSTNLLGHHSLRLTNGIAVFTDLACTTIGTNLLVFSTGLFSPVTANPVLVHPGPAAKLIFTVQPTQEVAGLVFKRSPSIQALDAYANPTTNLAAKVSATLSLFAGTGPLKGTTVLDIGADSGRGELSFTNLSLDIAGADKQLAISAPGLQGETSDIFTVMPPNSPPAFSGWTAMSMERIRSFGAPATKGMYLDGALVLASDNALYGTAYTGGGNQAGTLFRVQNDGADLTVLHTFTVDDGQNPVGALVEGLDGFLYGTTSNGGTNRNGVVFKMSKDGAGFYVLHDFLDSNQGSHPLAGLVQLADGTLYGTTSTGGTNGAGTLFKLRPDGTSFAIVHSFGAGNDGALPRAELLRAQDGGLYGTTELGGSAGAGCLFRVNADGSGYAVFASLNGGSDGAYPYGGLMQATNGLLYGTAMQGGGNGVGTIFNVCTNGASFVTLHDFGGPDGRYPSAGLLLGQDGMLYGTTYDGGIKSRGVVFRVAPNGANFEVLNSFMGDGDSMHAAAPLIQLTNGTLIGTTYYGGPDEIGVIFSLKPDNNDYEVIAALALENHTAPWSPDGALIEVEEGVFYGTTYSGGAQGQGAVFRVRADGTDFRILHDFGSFAGDGQTPYAALLSGADGLLYGTTFAGGAHHGGTVFRINRDGSGYSILHHFGVTPTDGIRLYSELTQLPGGALLGVTDSGGDFGGGTLFELEPNGTNYHIIHSFGQVPSEGINPSGGLFLASNGLLYGSTFFGGSRNAGVLFSINTNGGGFTVLHTFDPALDGAYPNATLREPAEHRLLGTTVAGGSKNAGTVFAFDWPSATFSILNDFSREEDGIASYSWLTPGPGGYLYGNTYNGGGTDHGVIFRLTSDGNGYEVLWRFGLATSDGANPYVALTAGSDGLLYGGTEGGGDFGQGTAFRLRVLTNLTVEVMDTLDINLKANDSDLPAQNLTYGLISAPAGMTLTSDTGDLVWTPGENQPPGSYQVVVRVTDDGFPPLSATNTLSITVTSLLRPTWLTLTSDSATNRFGQPFSLRATVARVRGANSPTGDVTFRDGAQILGTIALADGVADLSGVLLSVGVHHLTAQYQGDASFAQSTNSAECVVVPAEQAPLVFTPVTPQIFGTTNLLEASGGSGTGNLVFTVLSGPGLIVENTRLMITSGSGTVVLQASREADDSYLPVFTNSIVTAVTAASALQFTTGPNPALVGQAVDCVALVSSEAGVPGGSVTFFADGFARGSVPLDQTGVASLLLHDLANGSHVISAQYSGDGDFGSSTQSLIQVINHRASAVTLLATPNPVSLGQLQTITGCVSGDGPVPTGSVTFSKETNVLAIASIDANGEVSIPITNLDLQTFELLATYAGDSFYATSSNVISPAVFLLIPNNGPPAGGTILSLTNSRNFGNSFPVTGVLVDDLPASIIDQGSNWIRFVTPYRAEPGTVSVSVDSTFIGRTTFSNAFTYNPPGFILDVYDVDFPGVVPAYVSALGGDLVTIRGEGLGSGDDITQVSLANVIARILSQSSNQVTVVAGACSTPGLGDVRVDSVSRGITIKANAFTYLRVNQSIDFPEPGDQLATNRLSLPPTASSGLPVSYTVEQGPAQVVQGTNLVFSEPGFVTLTASQAGNDYWNPAPGVTVSFLVEPAAARITLGSLEQTFDGTPKPDLVSTIPQGLPVTLTYNGLSEVPVAAGSYDVSASCNDPRFQGQVSGVLHIARASQSLTFAPISNQARTNTLTLSASASSGLPVEFQILSGPAWLQDTNRLTLYAAGPVSVIAFQHGSANFQPAIPVTNVFLSTNIIPALIGLETNLLVYTAVWGSSNPPVQSLIVSNAGELLLDFTNWIAIGSLSSNWFTLTPGTGQLTGGSSLVLTGAVDIAQLAPGTYFANYVLAGQGHPDNAELLTIRLDLLPASALVLLDSLEQVFDGEIKPVSITTLPEQLPVTITYNGSSDPPISAGSYAVTASIADPNYTGSVSGTLHVARANQSLTFPAIANQPRTNTLTLLASASSGLPIEFQVLSGPASLQAFDRLVLHAAGTVRIVASQPGDGNYLPALSITNTFLSTNIIPALIHLETNLLAFSAIWGSSNPPAQSLIISNAGELLLDFTNRLIFAALSSNWFTPRPMFGQLSGESALSMTGSVDIATLAAGTYFATNIVMDRSHPTNAELLVIRLDLSPAPARVFLDSLEQVFDQAAKPISVTTLPGRLPVSITYNGDSDPPVNAGSYAVTASISEPNYVGSASGVLHIARANQSLTFPTIANQARTNTLTLSASASSGLPVDFQVLAGPAILQNGNRLALNAAGTVSIVASQGGDTNFLPALSVTNTFASTNIIPAITQLSTNYLAFSAVWGSTNPSIQSLIVSNAGELALDFTNRLECEASHSSWFTLTPNSGLLLGGSALVITGAVDIGALAAGTYFATNAVSDNNSTNAALLTIRLDISPAPAQISLGTLEQVFNGTSKPVTVTTVPAHLPVIVTYDGQPNPPANAGSYAVTVSLADPNYTGSASGILNIAPANQTLTFPPIPAQARTNILTLNASASSGLPVQFSVLSGPALLQSGNRLVLNAAGTVTVVASQAGDANFLAALSVTNTFASTNIIPAVIQLETNLLAFSAVWGSPNPPTQTLLLSNPGELLLDLTNRLAFGGASSNWVCLTPSSGLISGGSSLQITGTVDIATLSPGTYFATNTVSDNNSTNASQLTIQLDISPAPAVVSLGSLEQVFDGTSRPVTVTTVPANLPVMITYDGQANPPINTGSYTVTVSIADAHYTGSASGILHVAPANQTLSFPPIPAQARTNILTLSASASSGLPVQFQVLSGPASLQSGNRLVLNAAGTVTVVASQSGNANYLAALSVTNTFASTNIIPAVIQLETNLLAFSAIWGSTNPPTQSLIISNGGELLLDFTNRLVFGGLSSNWFSLAPRSGLVSGRSSFRITGAVDIGALPPGSYFATNILADQVHPENRELLLVRLDLLPAPALVSLGSLEQVFDGKAKPISVVTIPEKLPVTITYNGKPGAPTNAGTYAITASVTNSNYRGSASGFLHIGRAQQTLAFAPIGDQPANTILMLSAFASSGLPVEFQVLAGLAALEKDNRLALNIAGTVSIVAVQAGNTNYQAAVSVTNTFAVTNLPPKDIRLEPIPPITALVLQPLVLAMQLQSTAGVGWPLTWRLGVESPAGSSINTNTGVFHWIPSRDRAGSTNTFSVHVTDSSIPPHETEGTFTVLVDDYAEFTISDAVGPASATNTARVHFTSSVGLTNADAIIKVDPTLLDQLELSDWTAGVESPTFIRRSPGLWRIHFAERYGTQLQSISATLKFRVRAERSCFAALEVVHFLAQDSGGRILPCLLRNSGRVIVTGAEPLLDPIPPVDGAVAAVVYGIPGRKYRLLSSSIAGSDQWQSVWEGRIPQGAWTLLTNLPSLAPNGSLFLRVLESPNQ